MASTKRNAHQKGVYSKTLFSLNDFSVHIYRHGRTVTWSHGFNGAHVSSHFKQKQQKLLIRLKRWCHNRLFDAWNTRFFISNTFISNEIGKKTRNAKQHTETQLLLFEIIPILHPHYHSKIRGNMLKNKQKNKYVWIHEITW